MARVNQELTFSRKPESNLPLNGNYNTNKPTSKQCVKDEQPVRKRKALTTLRNVSYEPIYYSQYLPENPNLFKPILNDLCVKTNHTYVLKLLFAAAEIIHRLDEERFFLSNLNNFYSEYIKDNSKKPKTTLEQFDDYLYRSADTIWLRALEEIHRHTRKKYNR